MAKKTLQRGVSPPHDPQLQAQFSLARLKIWTDLAKESLPFVTIIILVVFTGLVKPEALMYLLPAAAAGSTASLGIKKYVDKLKSRDN